MGKAGFTYPRHILMRMPCPHEVDAKFTRLTYRVGDFQFFGDFRPVASDGGMGDR